MSEETIIGLEGGLSLLGALAALLCVFGAFDRFRAGRLVGRTLRWLFGLAIAGAGVSALWEEKPYGRFIVLGVGGVVILAGIIIGLLYLSTVTFPSWVSPIVAVVGVVMVGFATSWLAAAVAAAALGVLWVANRRFWVIFHSLRSAQAEITQVAEKTEAEIAELAALRAEIERERLVLHELANRIIELQAQVGR